MVLDLGFFLNRGLPPAPRRGRSVCAPLAPHGPNQGGMDTLQRKTVFQTGSRLQTTTGAPAIQLLWLRAAVVGDTSPRKQVYGFLLEQPYHYQEC